ncbi:hypothetical protein PAPHI01_0483 [Pancytospora philotis]|nr:hypothetical protein PAPHI01_0483 [Pancytospora philotis]
MRYVPVTNRHEYIFHGQVFQKQKDNETHVGEFVKECCDFKILLPFIIGAEERRIAEQANSGTVRALITVTSACKDILSTATAHICRICVTRVENYNKLWKYAAGKMLHEITRQAMRDNPTVEAECLIGSVSMRRGRADEVLIASALGSSQIFLVFIPTTNLPGHMMMLSDVFLHEMVPCERDRVDEELHLSGNYMPLVEFSEPLNFESMITCRIDGLSQSMHIGDARLHIDGGRAVLTNRFIDVKNQITANWKCNSPYPDDEIFLTVLDELDKPTSCYESMLYFLAERGEESTVVEIFEQFAKRADKKEPGHNAWGVRKKEPGPSVKSVQEEKPMQRALSTSPGTGYQGSLLNRHAPSNECSGSAKEEKHSQQPSVKPENGHRFLQALLLSILITGTIAIIALYIVNKLF